MLTLSTWLREAVSARSVHCKVTPPFLRMLYSSEGSDYVQSTLKEWGVLLRLLEGEVST